MNRSQSVRYQSAVSVSRSTFTGAPQGTVLSPILFTLYTNDCSGSDSTPLIKYSDDSALADLSNSDSTYFDEVGRFSNWCKDNYLDLNVEKTKEMVIDFRKNPTVVPSLFIDDVRVERVSEYKYLGTILDDKLTFKAHTDYINSKCQSRIYCLQKLRSLNVNLDILRTFYRSFVESVLTFSFLCWFGGLSLSCKNVLGRVVNVCSKVLGERQTNLNDLYICRTEKKAKAIVSDKRHILTRLFETLPSGRRFRAPRVRTVRTKLSFIPNAIKFLNKSKWYVK